MQKILIKLEQLSVLNNRLPEASTAKPLLEDIDFVLKEGEWVTVVGPNGSGKSTLARVLAGFGTKNLTGHLSRGREFSRHAIPMVMQQPDTSVLGATPWEDVLLMLEQHEVEGSAIPEMVEGALRETGLYDRRHQPIQSLSGGQKQLTAIAGCLALKVPWLVLDEVTSMLDPQASELVMKRVRKAHATGTAVIWITQRLEELRDGDRVAAMKEGRLIYDGTTEGFYTRGRTDMVQNGAAGDEGSSGATAEGKGIVGAEAEGSEGIRVGVSVNGESVCERIGMVAPYIVQTAWALEEQMGLTLHPLPTTPEALVKAVEQLR
ncbi:energy-coupling factor ABC transporter ATP-binding protein [Paenibacillus sp. GCM10023252]|uniref:energy-coupling factor ABC transporter ATP-binding protein n=1 Tax=Paenibacillus sp. GCM10023252 TaxID=3252649 RepID=UPI00362441C8